MKYFGKGKQVQGDKIEAHFNCQEPEVGCSKDVPTEHEKDEIPPQLDNIDSTNDMFIEFQSSACLEILTKSILSLGFIV